jgi:hypothetical protein
MLGNQRRRGGRKGDKKERDFLPKSPTVPNPPHTPYLIKKLGDVKN